MKRISFIAATLTALLAFSACTPVETDYDWKPSKTIRIIVPWSAGGSTDQVTRLVANEIEAVIGQSVIVVNQPGASGAIGTRYTLDQPHDGYTWTAGSAASLGTYPVLNLLNTKVEDWHLFFTVANVPLISVYPGSPYETFGDLIEAMRENPNQVSVATAGVASSGHGVIEEVSRAAGVTYRHVTYSGGNPAVIATVSGEAQVTPQLATEQVDMVRAGRLRPLAAYSTEPLIIEGYAEPIPPITDWMPELKIAENYFGIWAPRGVPAEVIETMERIWEEHIINSEALQSYARQRGALFTPYHGEEAAQRTMAKVIADAWMLYDAGRAEVSPETLGYSRPE